MWRRIITVFAVVVLAYIIAVCTSAQDMATPPLLRQLSSSTLFPRLSHIARSFLPIAPIRYPASALTSTTTSSSSLVRSFSTSRQNMAGHDSKTFTEATLGRRTIYQLTNKSAIADDRIKQILTSAIKHVPSSFNSQSTRLVVLLRDEHVKFWNIVSDELKAIVPEDGWEKTAGRIAMFRSAFGSILFYEDPEAIRKLQAAQPAYHDKFPTWSEHTSAMHQYYLWTALEAEGFGANLQHYNPLPDKRAAETWNIPSEWALTSQLVFGVPAEGAAPAEKAFEPIDGKRLFIHG